jgi:MFS family permease
MTDHARGAKADPNKFFTADKAILLVCLVTYGMGQTVLFVVFPPLVETIGLTKTQFGLIFSISNIVLAVTAVYWGRLSDKVGRKPLLLLGLFGYAFGTGLLALALEWGVRGTPAPMLLFGAIILARVIYASIASAINPSASAYLADTTTPEQRTQGMALLGMSSGIGTMLGPAMGGALAFISIIFPLYVAIGLALLAMVLLAAKLKEPEKHETHSNETTKVSWFDPRVRPFLLLFFFFWMGFMMNQITIAFYLEHYIGVEGTANVARAAASALVAMAIWATIMQMIIINRSSLGPQQMIRIGFPIFAVGAVVLYFATSMMGIWIAFSLFGMSMAMANAGIAGGASISVEPHEQGAVGGLLSAAPIFGMVLGPLIGPALFDAVGPQAPALATAITFALLSLYAFTVKVSLHNKPGTPQNTQA